MHRVSAPSPANLALANWLIQEAQCDFDYRNWHDAYLQARRQGREVAMLPQDRWPDAHLSPSPAYY